MCSSLAQITLKKSDIILVLMDYFNSESLAKTLISLEKETSVSLYNYNKEITFLRKLILDAQWHEAEEFLQPLNQNPNFQFKQSLFELRKQKFLEAVESEPDGNNDVESLVKELRNIQTLCSQDEFNKLMLCLSTPSITEHNEYKNWNQASGRLQCFTRIREYLDIIYPIKDQDCKIDSGIFNKLLNAICLIAGGGSSLSEICLKFIENSKELINLNNSKSKIVLENDIGCQNKTKSSQNNLLKSTRNEKISQSIQVNEISEIDEGDDSQFHHNNSNQVNKESEYVTTTNNNNSIDNKTKAIESESNMISISDDRYSGYSKYNYDIKSFSLKKIIEDSNPIRASCFSPKGDYFALGTNSKSVKIFNLQNILSLFLKKKKIIASNANIIPLIFEQKNHHFGSIYCLDWSVSGRLLASGSNDKMVKLMVIPTLSENIDQNEDDILELPINGHKGTVRTVSFDPLSDLSLLSGGTIETSVKIWDTEKGENKGNLIGHNGDIHSIKWSNDGTLCSSTGSDKTIRFWDLRSLKTVNIIDASKHSSINDISILSKSQSNIIIAACHIDGKITIWDYYNKTLLYELNTHSNKQEIRSISFSPDGNYLMSGGFDSKIKLFNVNNSFGLLGELEHNDKVVSCKWHPDKPVILSTSADKTGRVWLPDKYFINI